MAEPNRTRAAIDAEAGRWLARRRLIGASAAEDAAFERWRDADPRHGAAFQGMSRTLEDIASLTALAELEPLEPAPRRLRDRAREGLGRRTRAVAAIGAAAAAVAIAAVLAPGLLRRPDLDQRTAVAEIRTLNLADGSRVTLGARSHIKVEFEKAARRVELTDGEAFFEVAHDPSRPFFVETGGAQVRVVGTKFDVRRGGDRVEVSVQQGVVEVRERGKLLAPAGPTRVLTAGERVEAVRSHIAMLPAPWSHVGAVERAAAAPGGWRDGQLTYDGVRLADLVADLNRYYAPGVRLGAGALGDTRLAASFKTHEIDNFLANLPSVLPVAVRRDPGGGVTITERPHP